MKQKDIHPIFDKMVTRLEREQTMAQNGVVIWMTGLSGSGKSTIALGLERRLHEDGKHVVVLDGDNIRSGVNSNLGFNEEDREENIRRIAEIARLFVSNGIITICSFVSPMSSMRKMAKNIISPDDFREVHVSASLEACEDRDVKGLYRKAREGQIQNFTGIDAPYEIPVDPWLKVETDVQDVEESVDVLYSAIITDQNRNKPSLEKE